MRGRRKAPTAFDVFAGCGGLSEGLKQAVFRLVGAVEIDELAAKTYSLNHPRVKVWAEDVSTLTANKLLKGTGLKSGELSLLAGCPPCQGFSSLRTRNGKLAIQDDRNDLIFEFQRLVKIFRPKGLMLENVPGLKDDSRLERFLRSIRGMGYRPRFEVLNAMNFGVPQRRRRFILIAARGQEIQLAVPSAARRVGGGPKVQRPAGKMAG